jgi:hypothetical protein
MTKIYLFVTLHCCLTSLSPRQMQVTDIKLAFDIGSTNYLNEMRFFRPSHNSTPLFLILPHLVSHNHINSFQAPKMPLLTLISLATAFASVSSSYPQKNLAFASHCLLSILLLSFQFVRSNGPYLHMNMMTHSSLDVVSCMSFKYYILHLFLMFSCWIF